MKQIPHDWWKAIGFSLPLLSPHLILAQAEPDSPNSDKVFELSPFEISTSRDIGYQARDTLAGTRLRTDVRDVANAITVVNQEFLNDTAATDAQSLLVYTTGTEVGGLQGNYAGVGDGTNARQTTTQMISPQSNTRVRGLAEADNVRGFFLTDIPWDSYNTSRVDIQRGANSMLFGIGSPAGIINANLKEPLLGKNFGQAEYRYGSHDSHRFVGDYNVQVLPDELAVRVIGLYDDQKYQQEPAYEEDTRYFVTARWEPKFLDTDNAHTVFKLSYENGNIEANHPRLMPPVDRITPWFDPANESLYQQTFNAFDMNNSDYEDYVAAGMPAGFGAAHAQFSDNDNNTYPNPNYSPWVSTPSGVSRAGDVFDGPVMVYPDPSSSQTTGAINAQFDSSNPTPDGVSAPFSSYGGITSYEVYARLVGLPGSSIGGYKEKSLTDPDIFDFYNNLLDGPNKHEWIDFDAFNASIIESLFDDRLGFELAYDMQSMDRGQEHAISGNGYAISVDVLDVLPNGQDNPNVGRPMVLSRGGANQSEERDRETFRATVFGEVRFSDYFDSDSPMARIFGRHRFTGMYQYNEVEVNTLTWEPFSATDTFTASGAPGNSISHSRRQIGTLSYLGPSMLGMDSAAAGDISRIKAERQPDDSTILLWDWSTAGNGDYVGWSQESLPIWNGMEPNERDYLYTGARKELDEIESQAFIWQGFLFDENVVPTLGWRKDKDKFYNSGNPRSIPDINAGLDLSDPNWVRPDDPTNSESGDSLTWGVVVHTPDFIDEKLPYGLEFSVYYGESENFQPAAGRVDIFADPVASPQGETTEYGLTVSALENRINLKVNWYETKVSNATLSGAIPNNYLIGAGEAWAYMFATQAKYAYENNTAVGSYTTDYAPDDPDVFMPYQPRAGQTLEQAIAEMQTAVDAYLANPAPKALEDAWGYDTAAWYGDGSYESIDSWINSRNSVAGNLAVTGDTESEGYEIELSAQILDNWNVMLNVSKTSATRLNLGSTYAAWIEERWDFYQTEAGNVRFWEDGKVSNETLRSKFQAEVYGNYQLYRQLQGSDVPELRPWRFNLVTNYRFREGFMEGVNIGGGWRWQDEVTLGYPTIEDEDGDYMFDVDNPYKGDAESDLDLWIGYERDLTHGIGWSIQLNVRNAFADDELIPVSVQTDGSPAVYRIKEGTTFYLTNSFTF
ncbi:MAG: TonB-dependent receptor plug [Puniceicoccaceae bacterium 5H]|nr:MAG: TonB-dependent receptor plug [Puniceicoccaceae bacterium 5H]